MIRKSNSNIRDVASLAGVSPGSVSKVLNSSPGCRVSPEIRERIRSIGDTLIAVGRKNNVLRDDTSVEDLYIALVGIPMQYLASRYKFGFGDETGDQRRLIEKITAISLSAIQ